ncbi:MAG: methionine--tRNA ligase [Candidatus Saccharibacteria bacterium]|nr:methionine--tRNA ligase [Candidatus Saccharibacteria bacterium]
MGKNLYITTAIPYMNAQLHIGNTLDYLHADIWTRYQKQTQPDRLVRFSIGTDDHGNKIAAKAKELNVAPKEYTDGLYEKFINLIKKMDIQYTDSVRTTDEHHEQSVQYIWKRLQPYIYKDKYEGWYCVGHEAFFTEKEVTATNGICPDHQTPYDKLSEENYYFKLSQFSSQIKEAIENKKMVIEPEFRQKEILNLIDSGLKDVSISRPKKSLSWGVPVPDDPDQVIYVWIDALPNYLSVIGYPDKEVWQDFWPADVQVLGKDILRFHAAIWPAILIALELPLPKRLLVHGFINVDSKKISKTVGNVVDPNEIIDTYGLDAFRYFFSRHIPTLDDGDFTWEVFESAYNNELANELGNLIQRVGSMINRYQSGVIGDHPKPEHDIKQYRDYMNELKFNRALDEVWNMVRELNVYIENVKPWQVAKEAEQSPEEKEHLDQILAYASGSLLQIADLLTPFLPSTAKTINEVFGSGLVKLTDTVLFPKIHNHTESTNK